MMMLWVGACEGHILLTISLGLIEGKHGDLGFDTNQTFLLVFFFLLKLCYFLDLVAYLLMVDYTFSPKSPITLVPILVSCLELPTVMN